ncbi:MAG TPA: hypothetical protein VG917_03850 [Patescibacteria group bacterium]|nr:hypothetical protein [Patescibacteria group bacterium]
MFFERNPQEVDTTVPGLVKVLDYPDDFSHVRQTYEKLAKERRGERYVDLASFPVSPIYFHRAFPYMHNLMLQGGLKDAKGLTLSQSITIPFNPDNASTLSFLKFEGANLNVHVETTRASAILVKGPETSTLDGEEYLKHKNNRDRVMVDIANFIATARTSQ